MFKDRMGFVLYSVVGLMLLVSMFTLTQISSDSDVITGDDAPDDIPSANKEPIEEPPGEFYEDVVGPVPGNETKT